MRNRLELRSIEPTVASNIVAVILNRQQLCEHDLVTFTCDMHCGSPLVACDSVVVVPLFGLTVVEAHDFSTKSLRPYKELQLLKYKQCNFEFCTLLVRALHQSRAFLSECSYCVCLAICISGVCCVCILLSCVSGVCRVSLCLRHCRFSCERSRSKPYRPSLGRKCWLELSRSSSGLELRCSGADS